MCSYKILNLLAESRALISLDSYKWKLLAATIAITNAIDDISGVRVVIFIVVDALMAAAHGGPALERGVARVSYDDISGLSRVLCIIIVFGCCCLQYSRYQACKEATQCVQYIMIRETEQARYTESLMQ